jgi:hypothetical protein
MEHPAAPEEQNCQVKSFVNKISELEQNQSKRALDESLKGGFFLRKKPLEGIAPGYSYSDFAIASAARKSRVGGFAGGLPDFAVGCWRQFHSPRIREAGEGFDRARGKQKSCGGRAARDEAKKPDTSSPHRLAAVLRSRLFFSASRLCCFGLRPAAG